MKVTTMSMLSLVCLMGVILGIHANGYGGAAYSYYPVSPGYYGGGGGGWGNGGFRTYTIKELQRNLSSVKIQYVFVLCDSFLLQCRCKIAILRMGYFQIVF